ncbi:hypothetical protein [Amycolatopsis australiensis]|uniref:Sodium Bile acid symporter family protein n=1 Tax=Amycolatopsis australiensis TaxID=546364 RepID=A0A1K1RTI5_9PSEU|nr:Sodium Bile acid symporter family protein [Amycolatopsis australiensis]
MLSAVQADGISLPIALGRGNREAAAVLVALNSMFQVIAFGLLSWVYLAVLPGWLGLPQAGFTVFEWQIAKNVLIFFGIPLVLFALRGDQITSRPLDVARIAIPLTVYFGLMGAGSCALGKAPELNYERTATPAFTAVGNNFELAHRHLRRRQRPGARRGRRPAGRSPRARRARVRLSRAAAPLR